MVISPEWAEKTAFVDGEFCNASATFQGIIDIVLSGLNVESCAVYLDDVIVFGQS